MDEVKLREGLVAESSDASGPIAESISMDMPQLRVHSHVDRRAGTFSTEASRGDEWRRQTKEAEEEAAGWAIARVLEKETGISWFAELVPKKEEHPDVRVKPRGDTTVDAHEVEVRHLDEAAIAAINSGRALTRSEQLSVLEMMLKNAVMAKHGHYDLAWIPKGTLALQVAVPVASAYVASLRDAAANLGDGFRELWLVVDGQAHRLRPHT